MPEECRFIITSKFRERCSPPRRSAHPSGPTHTLCAIKVISVQFSLSCDVLRKRVRDNDEKALYFACFEEITLSIMGARWGAKWKAGGALSPLKSNKWLNRLNMATFWHCNKWTETSAEQNTSTQNVSWNKFVRIFFILSDVLYSASSYYLFTFLSKFVSPCFYESNYNYWG